MLLPQSVDSAHIISKKSAAQPTDSALNMLFLRPILSRAAPDLFPTATLSLGY